LAQGCVAIDAPLAGVEPAGATYAAGSATFGASELVGVLAHAPEIIAAAMSAIFRST
jgi:hypothetical protein